MTSVDFAELQAIPISVSIAVDQAPAFIARINAMTSPCVAFVLADERVRLGARKSATKHEFVVSFAVGVASSIVATEIMQLFAHPAPAPINQQMTIGDINVTLEHSQISDGIAQYLEQHSTKRNPVIAAPDEKDKQSKSRKPPKRKAKPRCDAS